METFEFVGTSSGDGECFCFSVDIETFIKLYGKAYYEEELRYRKECYDEVPSLYESRKEEYLNPTSMDVYPSKFFKSDKKLKIKIEVEEV